MNYRCSGCGEAYGESAWRGLALAERIEPEQVARILRNWPAGFCVEVRRCRACGKTVAAKRSAADALEGEERGRATRTPGKARSA